jgi:hypothetical protein
LFFVQAVSFLCFCALIATLSIRARKQPKNLIVSGIAALVLAGVAVDYLLGNFDFRPRTLLASSVTHSPVGLFHYLLFFWAGTIAALLLSNAIPLKE